MRSYDAEDRPGAARRHNGVADAPPGLHPGLRQTPEYLAWAKRMKETTRGISDFAYHDTMDEILHLAIGFMHRARQSQDDIAVRSYLWGAGRCLQEAVTIYDDRQAQNRAAIEQGRKK